jgi:ferredoxin-NADP reductase/Na+-transporting NADH:ubiquinone oxidoreductase subunit NqrB
MEKIDYVLDRITMYRLVLYVLIALVLIASILSFFSLAPSTPAFIILSALVLVGVGWIANFVFAWAFDAPTNFESVYITALILSLIMTPAKSFSDLVILSWAIILAMLSKYVLAINKKHIFNPAAIGVVITGLFLGESASWWVGTAWMAPFVAICGFLIIRKLRFFDLAWGFFMSVLVVSLIIGLMEGDSIATALTRVIFDSSMLFLGSIMVTEPLTMPPKNKLQMIYGIGVGVLSVPQVSIFGLSFSPEMALCIGNIFAYIVSPKWKLVLTLVDKAQIAKDSFEFIFKPPHKFAYEPGQYMEWTLPHTHFDARGNRRYFTLASSPTEKTLQLGVKFSQNGSSYKKALLALDNTSPVVAGQVAGEFTLPKNPKQKIAFFAGGIGITPFRSMIKYLIDTKEHRDIILCYSNKVADEIAYRDVFDVAQKQLSLKTVYTLTDKHNIPSGWKGEVGRIDEEFIKKEIPDFSERLFYLSGPQTMVNGYEKVLRKMKVSRKNIEKDFFPGLT